jgi:hypothetical protein
MKMWVFHLANKKQNYNQMNSIEKLNTSGI